MLLFQVVKMVISSAHEPARLRGDLEPRYDYGLGVLSWQTLAPRFCARRAAASGRSTGHGARTPSLQTLETVPENSQLNPRILLHRDPGCNGLAAGAVLDTPGCRSGILRLLEASTTPNPRFLHCGRCCQRCTTGRVVQETSGGCGHASLCRAGPGDRSASATTTNAGSQLQRRTSRMLTNTFPKYQNHTIIGMRMTANIACSVRGRAA